MTLTQKQQRALFAAVARAALAVVAQLDGDYQAAGDLPFEKLDAALADVARTTFRKRLSTLVPPA